MSENNTTYDWFAFEKLSNYVDEIGGDRTSVLETGIDVLKSCDNAEDDPLLTEELTKFSVAAEESGDIPHADSFVSDIKQATMLPASPINDWKDEARSQIRAKKNDGCRINVLLESDRLKRIEKIEETDSNRESHWIWFIETRDGNDVSIQTKREWKDETKFREILFDQLNEQVGPTPDSLEDWRPWAKTFVLEHQDVTRVEGPRTQAVEDLRSKVQKSKAYRDEKEAVQAEACWLPDEREETLCVPNTYIQDVTIDHDLASENELYYELRAEGLTTGNAVRNEFENGMTVGWWQLSVDFATPAEVVEATGDDVELGRGDEL